MGLLPILGIAGSLLGASAQARAADKAAKAQTASAQMGIDEQRRQFDAIQELLSPFVQQGTGAIQQMSALAGIGGMAEQTAALDSIAASPQLQQAIAMGERALLANASATGGLRGGNTQAALMELRPSLFSQAIDQRYQMLGGLAGMGQASAAGQAAAGQNMANTVTGLLGQQGAARAGAALARGQAMQSAIGGIGEAIGYGMTTPKGQSIFGQWGF